MYKEKQQTLPRDRWDPDNDLDLAGILITISTVARRLAQLLLDNAQKGGKHNG